MSSWLKPINLKKKFSFGSGDNALLGSKVPDWLGFIIWAGWWMRLNHMTDARMFLVMLLPTREVCSSICTLGAILGSVGKRDINLTWDEMLSIPDETKIYLRFPGEKKDKKVIPIKGRLSEIINYGGQIGRKITIDSKAKRFEHGNLIIFQNRFDDYLVTLTPHLSKPKEGKLAKINLFFKNTSPEFHPSWIHARKNECHLITNKAAWLRDVKTVFIYADNGSRYKLYDLLMPSTNLNAEHSRFLVTSPKSDISEYGYIPLSILDGLDALKSWESVESSNVIIILDQMELNEDALNILALLSSARDDSKIPLITEIPSSLPEGIQSIICAFPKE